MSIFSVHDRFKTGLNASDLWSCRMGGLLIADAALDVAFNTREEDPMWPRIVAVMGKF